MYSDDIRNALKKIAKIYESKNKKKIFYRVCACDMLPKRLPTNQDVMIICNTDKSTNPGEHWLGLYLPAPHRVVPGGTAASASHITKNNIRNFRSCHFFDSYGYMPTNEYIINFIKKNAREMYWNRHQLQSYHSYTCGEYCCMFAYSMAKNNNIKCFLKQFGKKLHSNDVKIRSMFNCTFYDKKCTQHSKSYFDCVNKT